MRLKFGLVVIGLFGCDGGLEPPSFKPGIAGKIEYEESTWPSSDSLEGLWLCASTDYPLDSATVISGVLVNGTILVYPSLTESLPFFVASTSFDFPLPPAVYRYVGVIQQYRPGLAIENFRMVGFLESTSLNGEPREISITEESRVENLRLFVNFHQLPTQPFY